MKVAPSIIAADFTKLNLELKKIENAYADLVHLDIMDGVFVPNLTFGPMIVEAINAMTELELDAHLMIINPEKYLRQFIDAGCDWISFHTEATTKTNECIKLLKKEKKKVGLAINPETPFKRIIKFIDKLDFLLIMSVHPGFYGQKFIPETLKKIEQARNFINRHNYPCLIQVDGGINGGNAQLVFRAGADIIVAGAGVFKTRDYKKAIRQMKCLKI